MCIHQISPAEKMKEAKGVFAACDPHCVFVMSTLVVLGIVMEFTG